MPVDTHNGRTPPGYHSVREAWQFWCLLQFDQLGGKKITKEFWREALDVSYFKYQPTVWVRSTAQGCEECEYFGIHVISKFGPDNAAA